MSKTVNSGLLPPLCLKPLRSGSKLHKYLKLYSNEDGGTQRKDICAGFNIYARNVCETKYGVTC